MQRLIAENHKTIEKQHSKNQELINYIGLPEKNENIAYKGKDISEVIKKSQSLKSFSTKAQTALWFAESFGLELKTVVVVEKKSGITHMLTPQGHQGQVGTAYAETFATTGFEALSDDEKAKVERVLLLLDKFCVGDLFYHKPTMDMACQSHTWSNKGRTS